jgi:hypothetical protein
MIEKLIIIAVLLAAIFTLGWLDNLGGIGPADVRANHFPNQK